MTDDVTKKAYKSNEKYKRRYNVVLTPLEGKLLDKILEEKNYKNLSQFIKAYLKTKD